MSDNVKALQQAILTELDGILPAGVPRTVSITPKYFGKGLDIAIKFSASTKQINGVRGQEPQMVSLMLDPITKDIHPQIFGGNGGNRIYRKPNREVRREKYLAMASEKIAFRQPKREDKFIIRSVGRFAEKWLETLKKHRSELMYQDLTDYSFLD